MNLRSYLRISTFSLGLFSLISRGQSNSAPMAADPSSYLGARSIGQAGSTVASSLTQDSLFQNPASAAFGQRYSVTLGYEGVGDSLAASIVDTKSGPVGGGIYYLRRDLRNYLGGNTALGNYSRLEDNAGFSLMGHPTENLAVGINVHYQYRTSYDGRVPSGALWNGDVGVRFLADNNISLGLIGENLLTDNTGANMRRFSLGVEWGFSAGMSLAASLFKLSPITGTGVIFTVPNPTQTVGWNVGANIGIPGVDGLAGRLGYSSNPTFLQNLGSVGAGYDSKSFGIDYAFQFSTDGTGVMSHNLSLTGYF